jgi:hypothetical protein
VISSCGDISNTVFETRLPDLDTLKQTIVEEINAIQAATLSHVMENVVTRVHECIKRDGQHKWHYLKKKKTMSLV